MDWMMIWKVVLVTSLALFFVLTLITAVLGAADVRRLFQRLEDDRQDAEKH